MSNFIQIPEHELLPPKKNLEPTPTRKKPLHIVAFTRILSDNAHILTLPHGKLINGERVVNIVRPLEMDAYNIAKDAGCHEPSAHAHLYIPNERLISVNGYALNVNPERQPLDSFTDFTQKEPTDDHQRPLELHNYYELLERIADDPEREIDTAYLRAFGAFALSRRSS